MPRPNRNMSRVSFFASAKHTEIVAQLAKRKGLTPSDIYRAMLKKYLTATIMEIQKSDDDTGGACAPDQEDAV